METVGDYEYGQLGFLGSGAFAAVFKGRHRVNKDDIVAVKKIPKSNTNIQGFTSKEIKVLEELTHVKHENVVNLIACKDADSYFCLVMEYCNGGTLADYMQARGVLSEITIGLFFQQIAEAMKVLHSKGIIHRDLKPHNILLCHTGKQNPSPTEITLKIADFGFARFLEGGIMAATVCGSPLYMAPEIMLTGKYDAKADLWSVAVICYQCLVGRPPFPANSFLQLQTLYIQNPDAKPIIPSTTSRELTNLLINLLKIKPQRRMDFDTFFNHPFFTLARQTAGIDRNTSNSSLSSLSSDMNILSSSPLRCVPVAARKHRTHRQNHSTIAVQKEMKTPVDGKKSRDSQLEPIRPESPDLDDFVVIPDVFVSLSDSDDDYDTLMAMPSRQRLTNGSNNSLLSETYDAGVDPRACIKTSPTVTRRDGTKFRPSQPITVPQAGTMLVSPRPVSVPSRLYAITNNGRQSSGLDRIKGELSSLKRTSSNVSMQSLSPPPAVQFLIGTPPSHPCSRCNSLSSLMTCSSPRSATPSSFDGRPMSYEPACCLSVSRTHPTMQGPVSFVAPELAEQTLMTREQTELMMKLEFTRDLSNSLIELARARSSPLTTESVIDDVTGTMTSLHSVTDGSTVFVSCQQRNVEQLLLYVRALELLASALNVARSALATGQLQTSPQTRQVLREINNEYQQCLLICKYLSKDQGGVSLADSSLSIATTDKLIFSCAIEMCQSAVTDELLGEINECCHQYQMAYLLLHSLAQQASNIDDRKLINKYKDGVEKRLMSLFNQGLVGVKYCSP